MTLEASLEKVQSIAPRKRVYLGSKSGYVFIACAAEILTHLSELNDQWSYEGLKNEQYYVPFEKRNVVNSYPLTSMDDGMAIIVEGEEQGPYWDLEEFRKKA